MRLKERVFEDPGGPTMMRGVCVIVQMMVAKRFSLSASVLAMPAGRSIWLMYQSSSSLKAFEKVTREIVVWWSRTSMYFLRCLESSLR